MSDSLQRFLFEGAPIRGELVHLDATWRAVLERHDYPAPLRAVLGELMAAAALLSATLKFDGSMILQIQASGAVKLIVVECTSEQTMRATAKWDGELPDGGLRALVGDGRFVITIVPNDRTQTYQGIVALSGDTVAAVLEHYMATSEQLETRLWLAADETQAAGMLLQRVPAPGGAAPQAQGDADAWPRALALSDTLRSGELLTLPARELIRRLFHEEDVRVFEPRIVSFRCSCTRERVVDMLRMLGRSEVHAILSERGAVEVGCEFCNRRYRFDAVDAEQVFAADLMTPARRTRH
jgi:molecular chaperone Hsp33